MATNKNGMDTSLLKILDGATDTDAPIATDPRNGSEDNILLKAGGLGKKSGVSSNKSSTSQPSTGNLDINGSYKSIK